MGRPPQLCHHLFRTLPRGLPGDAEGASYLRGMKFLRIFAIGVIFAGTSLAWLILGAITSERTGEVGGRLSQSVNELWGNVLVQRAPELALVWTTQELVTREEMDAQGRTRPVQERVTQTHQRNVMPDSSKVQVGLRLDQRLKGLMWYSLYDVAFAGSWSYVHQDPTTRELRIAFAFPDQNGIYDDFHFELNGQRLQGLEPVNGRVETTVPVKVGDELQFQIGYRSRGVDSYTYQPTDSVGTLRNFDLSMNTDFAEIDFPSGTMSPSERTFGDEGWTLRWKFAQVVTGRGIGMAMPKRIQPGELAAALSFSAPISLFFYFLLIFVLATLRQIDLHPINYLFLAGAFFAFHLAFAYSVDHLTLVPAFVVSSLISLLLAGTYSRLVVSGRFAIVEAGLAQLIYLIGFSLAHFVDGYTGLTVTALSIATLFLLMQLTGRIRWSEVLRS